MSGKIVLIYTLFGTGEEARHIAMTLMREKLIACANHFAPAVSQYQWQGDFCEEQEFPVLFKTNEDNIDQAMARLKVLHSFDTPAILSWKTWKGDPEFHKWLGQQLEK